MRHNLEDINPNTVDMLLLFKKHSIERQQLFANMESILKALLSIKRDDLNNPDHDLLFSTAANLLRTPPACVDNSSIDFNSRIREYIADVLSSVAVECGRDNEHKLNSMAANIRSESGPISNICCP